MQKAKEEITKSRQSLEKGDDALMKLEKELARNDFKADELLVMQHLNSMVPPQQQF